MIANEISEIGVANTGARYIKLRKATTKINV